jgi:hypothetical protein
VAVVALAESSLDFDFGCWIAAASGFDFDSNFVNEFEVDFVAVVVITAAELKQITPADSGSDSWVKSLPASMLVHLQFSWVPEVSLFQQKFVLDFQAYFDAKKCCLNLLSF